MTSKRSFRPPPIGTDCDEAGDDDDHSGRWGRIESTTASFNTSFCNFLWKSLLSISLITPSAQLSSHGPQFVVYCSLTSYNQRAQKPPQRRAKAILGGLEQRQSKVQGLTQKIEAKTGPENYCCTMPEAAENFGAEDDPTVPADLDKYFVVEQHLIPTYQALKQQIMMSVLVRK